MCQSFNTIYSVKNVLKPLPHKFGSFWHGSVLHFKENKVCGGVAAGQCLILNEALYEDIEQINVILPWRLFGLSLGCITLIVSGTNVSKRNTGLRCYLNCFNKKHWITIYALFRYHAPQAQFTETAAEVLNRYEKCEADS